MYLLVVVLADLSATTLHSLHYVMILHCRIMYLPPLLFGSLMHLLGVLYRLHDLLLVLHVHRSLLYRVL